jgi:Transglycosylase SLT domain
MTPSSKQSPCAPDIRHRLMSLTTNLALATLFVVIPHLRAIAAEVANCALPSVQTSPEIISKAIDEASRRFRVPSAWICAVMRAESHGDARIVSEKGAIGLMQIMPATYEEFRIRRDLGPDPFNPRDNILAGAAYLSELFERYGGSGFLAAYNAGPQRYEEYLYGRRLPNETAEYISRLTPKLGLEHVPALQVPASSDMHYASIFVALTAEKQTQGTTDDSGANSSSRSQKAAPHPLFRALRDNQIFARGSLSSGASSSAAYVAAKQSADLFVARQASETSR